MTLKENEFRYDQGYLDGQKNNILRVLPTNEEQHAYNKGYQAGAGERDITLNQPRMDTDSRLQFINQGYADSMTGKARRSFPIQELQRLYNIGYARGPMDTDYVPRITPELRTRIYNKGYSDGRKNETVLRLPTTEHQDAYDEGYEKGYEDAGYYAMTSERRTMLCRQGYSDGYEYKERHTFLIEAEQATYITGYEMGKYDKNEGDEPDPYPEDMGQIPEKYLLYPKKQDYPKPRYKPSQHERVSPWPLIIIIIILMIIFGSQK